MYESDPSKLQTGVLFCSEKITAGMYNRTSLGFDLTTTVQALVLTKPQSIVWIPVLKYITFIVTCRVHLE